MARNLGVSVCYFCNYEVKLIEKPRKISRKDAGVYVDQYRGMLVAKGVCYRCFALYLAWIDKIPGREITGDDSIQDLSFRSTFNDEPGEKDLPLYEIKEENNTWEIVGPYKN